jgi:hypothetical protein
MNEKYYFRTKPQSHKVYNPLGGFVALCEFLNGQNYNQDQNWYETGPLNDKNNVRS